MCADVIRHRLLLDESPTCLARYALIYAVHASHMHIQVTRIMKFTLTYETLVILDFMVNSSDMLPKVQSLNEGLITQQANDLLVPVVDSFTVTFEIPLRREIFFTDLTNLIFDL